MSDKKHIDRLFQEGLKDFEATPNYSVWENIEAKLNKKKKKQRVIPIWWQYAGIAAVLLLLLTIGGIYFNSREDIQTNQVVETEESYNNEATIENKNTIEGLENTSEKENVITNNTDSSREKTKNSSDDSNFNEAPSNKIAPSNESSLVEHSASKNKNESKLNKEKNKSLNPKNNLMPSVNNNAIANLSKEELNDDSNKNKTENNAVATSSSEENNEDTLINKEKAKELIQNSEKNNTAIAETKDEEKDALAENNIDKEDLTIEEVLEKNKNIIEKEEANNRWSIAPNAAPVYFNTLGNGSSIDPQFNNNAKSGQLNMSYGLSASYAINSKLTVRSGINKVNLGYNTNDVVVFQSVGLSSSSRALQNVSPSNNSGSNALSSDVAPTTSFESLSAARLPESLKTTNTSINQSLGYIEVPLEIQYTLSDKKLGVNVIGGFSSFFLNDNEIYSETENGNRTFLGEANNINKVSYSANFGLGFNYKMSKKIDLNLEPMFKYQLNTFKNTSGNFTPFIIGVYTGFAIKF